MAFLAAIGRCGNTSVDVDEYDEDEGQGYSIQVSQEDLDIDFGSINAQQDLEMILANAVGQKNSHGKVPAWTHLPLCVIRDTEFDDRYWITNGSNDNWWRLKRTPEQIQELMEALRQALHELNRPEGHP